MKPKVSFIMPSARTDNFEYIRNAVDSIMAQSIPEWELICILKGEPQGHPIYYYGDHRIKVYNLYAEYGVHFPKAYNLGLAHAQGDIITFAHDDDLQLREKAEILSDMMERRPEIDIIHSGWFRADKELNFIDATLGVDFDYISYKRSGSLSPNALGIRRESLKIRFNENYHRIHEYIYFLECAEAEMSFYHIYVPLFVQRIHNSFSRFEGAKELEFKEYDRFRKERNDPQLSDLKEAFWRKKLANNKFNKEFWLYEPGK